MIYCHTRRWMGCSHGQGNVLEYKTGYGHRSVLLTAVKMVWRTAVEALEAFLKLHKRSGPFDLLTPPFWVKSDLFFKKFDSSNNK